MEESKIRDLIDKLNYYTKLYDEGKPQISDEEWDNIYFDLVQLEKETGIYFEDSPTQRINYQVVNKLNKVEHSHPMLSLDKTKDIEDIKSFINNKEYIAMAKMDGLTCSLTYRGGRLVGAETRGNGIIGEDVLHNALVVRNIPNKIDFNNELIIDGEIICDYNTFKRFENDYKNPRNFASGSIRLLDSAECVMRGLSFVAWDVIEGLDEKYLSDKLSVIQQLGFTIVPFKNREGKDFIEENDIPEIKEKCTKYGYPIDGIVVKYNNCEEYDAVGRTDHHFKGGLAYKFYDDEYETTLKDIEFSISRNGVLTPVAIFEPIEIEGTEVSRANLFNLSFAREILHGAQHTLGWRGQKIKIVKANQIIPQVSWAEEDDDKTKSYISYPASCPICGHSTKIKEENGIEVLLCDNSSCEGKLVNRIDHFFGKGGLDAKGISKATIEKLIDWGWVNSISDMFRLSLYEDEWKKISGFGIKSVDNILKSIESSRNTRLESVLHAAGIPLVGKTGIRELIRHFHTYQDFKEAVQGDFDFSTLPNFGYEMNKALKTYDYTELDYIVNHYITFAGVASGDTKGDTGSQSDAAAGMNIVITGKLKNFKNRDELKDFIISRGGKVSDAVTAKTTYLINNDLNSTSSKNKKAKELNIPILSEDEFLKLFDL